MKMTDESALAAIERATQIAGLREVQDYLTARLAADQQKGGGVVVVEETTDRYGEHFTHVNAKLRVYDGYAPRVGDKLYPSPQPSIPAPAQRADEVHADALRIIERDWFDYVDGPPAQQDGKASGGDVQRIAQWLYADHCANQGIHCNRLPAYAELSEGGRRKWLDKAQAIAALTPAATPGDDPVPWEWRWVDENDRAMTAWKRGDPPPMLDVSDSKGTMRVEVRIAQKEGNGNG